MEPNQYDPQHVEQSRTLYRRWNELSAAGIEPWAVLAPTDWLGGSSTSWWYSLPIVRPSGTAYEPTVDEPSFLIR